MTRKLNEEMPRILIVAYDWPPRNAMGTHRAYAWAKSWSALGAEVTVLTAEKKSFDEPLDLELPPIDLVEVVEVPFGGSISGATRLLANRRIRLIGRAVSRMAWRLRLGNVDPRAAWFSASLEFVEAKRYSFDVVVSTFSPLASHRIAGSLKKANPQVFWVADFRDLEVFMPRFRFARWVQPRPTKMMRSMLSGPNLVSSVSSVLCDYLSLAGSAPAVLVRNGFDLNVETVRSNLLGEKSRRGTVLRLVYTGSINTSSRDLVPIMDCLVELENRGLIEQGAVRIDIYGSRVENVHRLIQKPHYAPYIRLMGSVTRSEALEAQRSADILLLLEGSDAFSRGTMTGKVFEYIAAGRPIFCWGVPSDFELSELIRDFGVGLSLGPSERDRLTSVILETLQGRGVFDYYRPTLDNVMKLSRDFQSQDFLETILDFRSRAN